MMSVPHGLDHDIEEGRILPMVSRKRTRISKACDFCNRRKMKCNGLSPERPKCSNCIAFDIECLFTSTDKRRGPLRKKSKMGPSVAESSNQPRSQVGQVPLLEEAEEQLHSDAEVDFEPLADWLQKMRLDPMRGPQPVSDASPWKNIRAAMVAAPDWTAKRDQFYKIYPWEMEELSIYANSAARVEYSFPDADLIPILIDRYFWDMGILIPIIHRPTFENGVRDGLYFRDAGFGAVLLLVCALGARGLDDPRVLLPSGESLSAGWKWYNQVRMVHKSTLTPPRLSDVQQYCLATQFLMGSAMPHVTWHIIGQGLRVCVDVSANRRNVYRGTGYAQIVEEEWKRAFWALVSMERTASLEMGRPLSIYDEDIDAPLPRDCDDEYWICDDKYFAQPPDKPTVISGFIHMLKMRRIQAYAMRTLFSVSHPKGVERDCRAVAELDAALTKWKEQLPTHLCDARRCDPQTPYFRMAFALHSIYHYTRIVVHRPFAIPARQTTHPLGPSAREQFLDSARQIAMMIDFARDSLVGRPVGAHMLSAFGAASALIICGTVDDLPGVYVCMKVIKDCEGCSQLAGRYWDVLNVLTASVKRPSSPVSHISGSTELSSSSAQPQGNLQQANDAAAVPVESFPSHNIAEPHATMESGMATSVDVWNPLLHEYEQLLGTMDIPGPIGGGPYVDTGSTQAFDDIGHVFGETANAPHLPGSDELTEDIISSWANGTGWLDSWAGTSAFMQGLGHFDPGSEHS